VWINVCYPNGAHLTSLFAVKQVVISEITYSACGTFIS